MFNFFKSKSKSKSKSKILTSPVNGDVIVIDKVNDPVFSQKLVGDGFAVEPDDGKIYSPVAGKVLSIFPTKHAISIITDKGLEVLVHMGIDTVELGGQGFEVLVQQGQEITHDTQLANIDLDVISRHGNLTTIIVAITNLDGKEVHITEGNNQVGAEIGTIYL